MSAICGSQGHKADSSLSYGLSPKTSSHRPRIYTETLSRARLQINSRGQLELITKGENERELSSCFRDEEELNTFLEYHPKISILKIHTEGGSSKKTFFKYSYPGPGVENCKTKDALMKEVSKCAKHDVFSIKDLDRKKRLFYTIRKTEKFYRAPVIKRVSGKEAKKIVRISSSQKVTHELAALRTKAYVKEKVALANIVGVTLISLLPWASGAELCPVITSQHRTIGSAQYVAAFPGTVVVGESNGFEIFRDNGTDLQQQFRQGIGGQGVGSLAFADNFTTLFVSQKNAGGITKFDISNTSSPFGTAFGGTGQIEGTSMALLRESICATTRENVHCFFQRNLTLTDSLSFFNNAPLGGIANDGVATGFVGADKAVIFLNFTNSPHPTLIKNHFTGYQITHVAFSKGFLFLLSPNSDATSGIHRLDVRDLSNVTEVGFYPRHSCTDLTLFDEHVCFAKNGGGVECFSRANVTNPTFSGSLPTPGTAAGVAAAGGSLYVADGPGDGAVAADAFCTTTSSTSTSSTTTSSTTTSSTTTSITTSSQLVRSSRTLPKVTSNQTAASHQKTVSWLDSEISSAENQSNLPKMIFFVALPIIGFIGLFLAGIFGSRKYFGGTENTSLPPEDSEVYNGEMYNNVSDVSTSQKSEYAKRSDVFSQSQSDGLQYGNVKNVDPSPEYLELKNWSGQE